MSLALLQVSTGLLDLVGPSPPDVAYIKSYGKLLRLLKLTAILWKMVPFQVLLTTIFRGVVDFSDHTPGQKGVQLAGSHCSSLEQI